MDKKRKIGKGQVTGLDNTSYGSIKKISKNDGDVLQGDREECYKFEHHDPMNMLQILMHNSKEAKKLKQPPALDGMNVKTRRIIELKDQIRNLSFLKYFLVTYVNNTVEDLQLQKEKEKAALFDTYSPFLSMGSCITSKILDFLDVASLYNAEQASHTLNEIIFENGHLRRRCFADGVGDEEVVHHQEEEVSYFGPNYIPEQYQARPKHSSPEKFHHEPFNSSAAAATAAVLQTTQARLSAQARYTGAMSWKAQQLEVLGEKHYDYNQDFKVDRDLIVNCVGCDDFRPGSITDAFRTIVEGDEDEKYFVRLSLWKGGGRGETTTNDSNNNNCDDDRNNSDGNHHQVVWQGFHSWQSIGNRFGDIVVFNLRDCTSLMDWPELQNYYNWLNSHMFIVDHDDNIERLSELVKDLRVTVLLEDGQLFLTSGGYYEVETEWAHLHPRNDCSNGYGGHATSLEFESQVRPSLHFRHDGLLLAVRKCSEEEDTSDLEEASDSSSEASIDGE